MGKVGVTKVLLSLAFLFASVVWLVASEKTDSLFYTGMNAYSNGDYENAIENFTKALSHVENKDRFTQEAAKFNTFLGIIYNELNIANNAIEYLTKANNLLSKNTYSSTQNIIKINISLASSYCILGDYETALTFLSNAERLFTKSGFVNILLKDKMLVLFADIYKKTSKYYLALAYIHKAQKIESTVANKLKKLNIEGAIYYEKNDYNAALHIFYKALKIGDNEFGEIYPEKDLFLTNIANIYSEQGRNDVALKYCEKAEIAVREAFGIDTPEYSDVRYYFADEYLKTNLRTNSPSKNKVILQTALGIIQESLIALITEFNNIDITVNPQITTFGNSLLLINILLGKSDALKELAKVEKTLNNSNEEVENFKISLTTYELAIDLINKTRNSYQSEESMMVLSENMGEAYFEACEVAVMLYEATGDKQYLNMAFQFSERGKSSSFLASVKGVKAMEFGGIPDSLLHKEKELKQEIAIRDEFILNEKQYDDADGEKINRWEAEVFELEKEYAELIKHYEEEFPEYYSFKYSDKVISIEEVQSSLPGDQSLVEYSIKEPEDGDDGEIITFVISKDSCSVNRIKIDSTFSKDIEHVITLLKEVIPGHTTLKKFANYSSSAYNLYNILIAPVKEHIKNTRVMFIPEGKLAYLPFDAFLTELPDTSKLRFWNLKYLVYDYAVSYSYSATLQFHYFSNSSVADKDFIAFAPKYKEIEIDMEKLLERDELLFPLPGAKWEVEEISNMIKGDVYIGEKSGEEVFKKSAGKYDIIHLAMHTVINDSLPMYSNLVFSNDSINRDNGRLNTHEIYNMEFNARLTVLSACNTGSGRLRKGEGVMSLARAFMYSGCPSIVMTLWSVSDNSSSEIMINFYRELIKGKSKDIALRDAKLRHIKNITSPLKANPFFWLGFVTIGDQSALYKNEKTVLGRYLILIGIIVVLIILSERLITNRKKRKRIRS